MSNDDEKPCDATAESMGLFEDDGTRHIHTCVGRHDAGDHFCGTCQHWWWVNPKPRRAVPTRKKVK